MKVLLFLPFVLVASSCLYPEPYATPPRSPYRQRGSAYPYGPRGPEGPPTSGDYGETGRYEQLSGPNPSSPTPPAESRPSAPRIDDDFDPAPGNPAPEPKPQGKKEYPTAEPSGNPDEVISPYEPHNKVRVDGYKSGQLVRDPYTQKIFRVP
jgi:hypothetical protein